MKWRKVKDFMLMTVKMIQIETANYKIKFNNHASGIYFDINLLYG
jgi:hypothetical protein